jgi:hypothetical protein
VDKLDALLITSSAERLGDFEVDDQLIFVGACTARRDADVARARRAGSSYVSKCLSSGPP